MLQLSSLIKDVTAKNFRKKRKEKKLSNYSPWKKDYKISAPHKLFADMSILE